MDVSTALQVFVSPLLGTLYDNLSPLILDKIGLVWGVDEEMEKLSNILLTIQDILEDAEDKQITNKLIHNWLRKLKGLTYDLEDLLDECATEALEPEPVGIIERASIAERIKTLINKFDCIAEERSRFHLINLSSTTSIVHSRVDTKRESSSFPTEFRIYGREEEKVNLVNVLVNNVVEGVSVCAIVGIGGLGKTTLAQMVYNDNVKIANHFDITSWVCVSEHFELKTILKNVIESFGENTRDTNTLDHLQRHLKRILIGKRFLLVLDDVWNEDQAKWERLKSSLAYGAKGSSIIVTTRLETVAILMGTLAASRPSFLSNKDCFSLFKHRAFAEYEEENLPSLCAIGEEIVKKCGGVPLAAKALGGLMRFKREENEWLFVRDSKLWDLPQDKEDAILPALCLSYKYLPSHLRQCFLYCSIFPKGYEIKKELLISLWVANGFVQRKGIMELEDTGNEIFNDLLLRSFFQDVRKDENGNILGCKMHDLVHDLACSITTNECGSMVFGKEQIFGTGNSIRHLTLDFGYLHRPSTVIKDFLPTSQPLLRTFLQLGHSSLKKIPPQFSVLNMKYLRVLDLSWTDLRTLTTSIGNLKHLRYLDLSFTFITSLPNEVFCKLRNLQTLKLIGCDKLEMLPGDIRNIRNLRHLDITGSYKLTRMPVGMGQLKCLQTLSIFIVDKDSGCGVEELEGLDHLRGNLTITGLEKVRNPVDAKNANLMRKQKLCSLELCWSSDSLFESRNNIEYDDEVVAEGLQPHPNIKKLHVKYYKGVKFPTWMMSLSCLRSLTRISLEMCIRSKHLPPLGKLANLKSLEILGLDSVKCIGDEYYYGEGSMLTKGVVLFPSLEDLIIWEMPNLEEWWSSSSPSSSRQEEKDGVAQVLAFPFLKRLTIHSCPKLRTCPPLPLSILHLILSESSEMILKRSLQSLPHLSYLSELSIARFDKLVFFPDDGRVLRNLTALQSLKINDCPKLKTLPTELMENLTALKYLRIWGCQDLVCLPEGMQNLTSLQHFEIVDCNNLKSLNKGLQHVTTLHTLFISDCAQLDFFMDDFQHLNALRHLKLGWLTKMTSLPLVGSQHLTGTLESIEIWYCSGLTVFPDWIANHIQLRSLGITNCKNLRFLSEGLQHLTALQTLEITSCHPDLHRRCEKGTGDDWYNIAHVPNLINKSSL